MWIPSHQTEIYRDSNKFSVKLLTWLYHEECPLNARTKMKYIMEYDRYSRLDGTRSQGWLLLARRWLQDSVCSQWVSEWSAIRNPINIFSRSNGHTAAAAATANTLLFQHTIYHLLHFRTWINCEKIERNGFTTIGNNGEWRRADRNLIRRMPPNFVTRQWIHRQFFPYCAIISTSENEKFLINWILIPCIGCIARHRERQRERESRTYNMHGWMDGFRWMDRRRSFSAFPGE